MKHPNSSSEVIDHQAGSRPATMFPRQTGRHTMKDEDDDLLELPPLDADDDSPHDHESAIDLVESLEPTDDPLDDAVASDLDVGIDVDGDDHDPATTDDADGLFDPGPMDDGLAFADEVVSVTEEEAHNSFDHVDRFDVDRSVLDDEDGAAEGTGENPEDAVNEQNLPSLDADDQGSYEAEDLVAELTELLPNQQRAWAPSPWVVIDGAGAAIGCSALDVSNGRVAAAGPAALLVIDEVDVASVPSKSECKPLPLGDVACAAWMDAAIIVATSEGDLLQIADDETVVPLGTLRGRGTPQSLAITKGRVWVVVDTTLWMLRLEGHSATEQPIRIADHVLDAVAGDDKLVAIIQMPGGSQLVQIEPTGQVRPLAATTESPASAMRASRLAVAANGRALALWGADALAVSRDGGTTFRTDFNLPPILDVAFCNDDVDTPLLSLHAVDGQAQVALTPALDDPKWVFALDRYHHDDAAFSGPAAIAWDSVRQVAWIACHAGLIAIAEKTLM